MAKKVEKIDPVKTIEEVETIEEVTPEPVVEPIEEVTPEPVVEEISEEHRAYLIATGRRPDLATSYTPAPPAEVGVGEETPPLVTPTGATTLADVPIGTSFFYGGAVYKKINDGRVLNYLNDDDATEPMNNATVIEPIKPGHEVEPDA